MNTLQLKRFAQEARKKLITLVGGKLEAVLTQDSGALRAKAEVIKKLKDEISEIGKEALIDKVAYTWFNRLVALRFMDANDYQPLGINILSPAKDIATSSPQILSDIHSGIFPADLRLDKTYINELLNGNTNSSNPDNDIFREVLIAVCNDLHRIFPFLFERLDDYSELLLPDDLTSSFSIIADVVNGMSVEDCAEVEIIGWLYQFYISELNEELISSKKVYKREELAPASQLFTPKWIVQYMVENTLGQLIAEQFPTSKVHESLEYYIKPDYKESIADRESRKIEAIQFFEPCVGSGHILSYAFDVFYKLYEEQGYASSEISELIIKNNLFGIDIDPRASQMASMVLMMKGRQRYRRFFKSIEKNQIKPNIYYYEDFPADNKFSNATVYGSLIKVSPEETADLVVEENSLFTENQQRLKDLYTLLSRKYDIVVTNPPYISSSRMEASLKQYVVKIYPETKSDLFSTFILRCLELCKEDGFTGYMTPFVWMFISSYEKLREIIINKHLINNLIQLEYSGFDGATVPICTFTLRNKSIHEATASYVRLSDFKGSENQAPKTLQAIQNPKCGWFHNINQNDFKKIPNYRFGYWIKKGLLIAFEKSGQISDIAFSDGLTKTGKDERFIRKIWEVSANDYNDKNSYRICVKGGEYRKYYGNYNNLVNWKPNVRLHYKKDIVARITPEYLWDVHGITWTKISSKGTGFRIVESGMIAETGGPTIFLKEEGGLNNLNTYIALLNSKITPQILKILSPTLNFQTNDILQIPLISIGDFISKAASQQIEISKLEWNSRETSLDFQQNELVRFLGVELQSAINSYKDYWALQFRTLHQNEEELNRQFIEIYGLQDELTPDVPLEDITILKEESKIADGQLVFREEELIAQLLSYAVGCIFGRYSLDKEGLILANHGENFKDYLDKVSKSEEELSFVPDEDNVVPVLDEEWFDDDIVNRVKIFIRAVWGDVSYQDNIQYIETVLGKDLSKYLTKDFYKDHIKRYKKRPIYWMFSSPKGHFNVMIYMHRYTPDTLNYILNSYLRPYMEKVSNDIKRQEDIIITGSTVEQGKARKRQDLLKDILKDCEAYEYDILYPLAGERIAIDLDDGVLVNYNKFGNAIASVAGLNDAKTKKKVREFDWIDSTAIR